MGSFQMCTTGAPLLMLLLSPQLTSAEEIWAVDSGQAGDIQNALSITHQSSWGAPVTEQVSGVGKLGDHWIEKANWNSK